jgi:hypothetical protein
MVVLLEEKCNVEVLGKLVFMSRQEYCYKPQTVLELYPIIRIGG